MKISKLHNSHFTFLFFGGCFIILFGAYDIFKLDSISTLILCFFLILTIGTSHGALDHEKGKKLFKIYKIKNFSLFYFSYLILGILIATLWLFFPALTLTLFLIVASYHFGKEDCIFPRIKNHLMFALKGSLIILAPLLFHFDDTINIFKILYLKENLLIHNLTYLFENNYISYFLAISILSNFFIYKINLVSIAAIFVDIIIILFINILYSPIVAFTVYFCFLHSIRHIISLILEMKINFNKFVKKATPLTLVTALIFIIFAWVITLNNYSLDGAILKVIFIGLASLTFPHILLEYLLEKNEK
jgi:beta-carotene 15,15'-dioxygenase